MRDTNLIMMGSVRHHAVDGPARTATFVDDRPRWDVTRGRRGAVGVVAAVTAFGLSVAYSDAVGAPFWSPKAAVLLIGGAVGLSALRNVVRSPARPVAIAAISYLALVATSTALSPAPLAAIFGAYNAGTGLLFLAACVGLWALGACVERSERNFVLLATLTGIGISAVVGILQVADLIAVESLRSATRASGLSGNAVYLGSLAAAAAAAGARLAQEHRWGLAVAALGAFVVQLSGTRSGLLFAALAAVAGAMAARGPTRVLILGAVLSGVALGSVVAEWQGASSASGRVSAVSAGSSGDQLSSGGNQVRLEVWSASRHAIARRPLFGHGPGRYRAATSADQSLREAQLEPGDVVYDDGHNILVQHLVTTGAAGTLALVAWLTLALRRARGPWAWFAVVLALMALFQPLEVGVTPFLFLALGVAGAAPTPALAWRNSAPIVALATIAAALLLIGDSHVHRAARDRDLVAASAADRLLPDVWYELASLRALIYSTRGDLPRAKQWWSEAHERDPTSPIPLLAIGDTARRLGRLDEAEDAYLAALERSPWSSTALDGLAVIAEQRRDVDAARVFARRSLEIEPSAPMEELLARLDRRRTPDPRIAAT